MKVDRELVVATWIIRGLTDFYISFEFEDLNKWHAYSAFLCHQGLEKVSKAYLLAARSAEYENLRGEEALRKADQIAKEHQHSLRRLLDELGSRNVLTGAEVSRKIEGYTGEQVIDILEKAYIESRYPVPSPIHRKFPIHRRSQYKIYHDLLGSTAPIKYSRKLAWTILKKIEQDFGIITSQQKLATHISDAEWTRFCSLFFGLESA